MAIGAYRFGRSNSLCWFFPEQWLEIRLSASVSGRGYHHLLTLLAHRIALLPVAVVAFWYLSTEAVATDQYSTSTRLDAWLIMLEIIKVNPVFGFGPANYYWYTPLFPIRGYYVPFNSHSQYVDIVAQTGLLGLAFFLWFFFEVGRLGWQLQSRVPEGFAQAYVYGALGGLAEDLVVSVSSRLGYPLRL